MVNFFNSIRDKYIKDDDDDNDSDDDFDDDNNASLNNNQKDLIDNEIKTMLNVLSKRIKLLDDLIEKVLSNPLNYFNLILNNQSINFNEIQRQHQHGKIISMNLKLMNVSNQFQYIQSNRLKKFEIRNQTLSNAFIDNNDNDIPLINNVDNNDDEIYDDYMLNDNDNIPQSQLQLLEDENENILNNDKHDLMMVEKVQHSLLSISTLQSEILNHLVQQSKLVESLYDDSLNSIGSLTDASKQLNKTQERQQSSRKFFIIFFIISGLSLLFLDYYS